MVADKNKTKRESLAKTGDFLYNRVNNMKTGNFFIKAKNRFENLLPMTLGSFILFLIILYFIFIVGKTTRSNYLSNQQISLQQAQIKKTEQSLEMMRYGINYNKTRSFKEKEAREKLGYRAPGEKVIALPIDKPEDKVADQPVGEAAVKQPNYTLWWNFLFDSK